MSLKSSYSVSRLELNKKAIKHWALNTRSARNTIPCLGQVLTLFRRKASKIIFPVQFSEAINLRPCPGSRRRAAQIREYPFPTPSRDTTITISTITKSWKQQLILRRVFIMSSQSQHTVYYRERHLGGGVGNGQHGRVDSVSDSQSSGPGYESLSDHNLDLFLGSPEFKSSATLVHSQLVRLRPAGILNNFMVNLECLSQLFARSH